MKVFLICLLIIGVLTNIPNCAYHSNNQCLSCTYGFQLANYQCLNCATGFIMVSNSCVNSTIYAQNTATALSGSSSSGSFQSFGNNVVQTSSTSGTGITSTYSTSTGGSPSTSQTIVVKSSNAAPVTTSTYTTTGSTSINPVTVSGSSTSGNSSYIFDTSNAGVMYFLQLFGMASQIPANCQSFTPNFICVGCVAGYSLLSNGVCNQYNNVNTNINSNPNSGSASTTTFTQSSISSDPNCQVPGVGNNGCQQCYFSYYFNSTLQKCTTVNPLCQTWTNQNLCLTCYAGYSLTLSGNCIITGSGSSTSSTGNSGNSGTSTSSSSTTQYTTVTSATDPFCQIQITGSNYCQQCYFGYYFNTTIQRCVAVNALCKTWTNGNLCLSCFNGYSLSNSGSCILSSSNSGSINNNGGWSGNSGSSGTSGTSGTSSVSGTVLISSDLNCQIPTAGSPVCQQCYYSFYYNPTTQKCQTVNPLCKSWNNQNLCLSCYDGYTLTTVGACITSNTQTVTYSSSDLPVVMDPFCNLYSKKVCIQCAPRTYFASNGSCIQIDPNCQSWNNNTGACSQCYVGYVVTNVNFCSIINPSVLTVQLKSSLNTDINCLKSTSTGVCTQCIFRYVLNQNSVCIKVSDLCQQWNNTTALCTSCYGGYTLSNGSCIVGN